MSTKQLIIRLTLNQHKQLKILSATTGITMQDIVTRGIEKELKQFSK